MSQVEFWVKVRDGADKILEGTALIRDAAEEQLERYSPVDKSSWDPSKIKWEDAVGTKGPYELAEPQATPDFKNMLADLKAHDGKFMRANYFYWVFKDQARVGRTWKGPKKKPPKAGSNPGQESTYEKMQSNLENLKNAGEILT